MKIVKTILNMKNTYSNIFLTMDFEIRGFGNCAQNI